MAGIGDFRAALMAQFQEDIGIRFVPGLLEGPQEQGDIGSCYVMRVAEIPGRIEEAELTMVVRVFKRFQPQTAPETPIDPSPLESLADALQLSILHHQSGVPGAWFQRITQLMIDPVKQGVEATVVATLGNAGLVDSV